MTTSTSTLAKPLVILAAGGHARVVLDAALAAGRAVAGLVDPGLAVGAEVMGRRVLGGDELLNDAGFLAAHAFALGAGKQVLRARHLAQLRTVGALVENVIHPAAVVSPFVEIGVGLNVMAGVVVNPGVRLGDAVVVNTRASIDHDCFLGENVFVAPGATLAGGVIVGEGAFIGAGAVVIDGLKVGAGARIGAGAAVIRDVNEGATVVGVPARSLSSNP